MPVTGQVLPHALQKLSQEVGPPARCNPFPCAASRDRLSVDQIRASLMRRREFIAGLAGAGAAWPLTARAQRRGGVRRVGVLMNAAATETVFQSYVAAFIQGLRQFGWTEGQNLSIDVRWTAGDAELSRSYAAQLIGLMPDVILAASTINLTAIRQATPTVPVVFVQIPA
jgi:putative tryptophan/tyrosine transport system substrate-binding protein